MPTGRNFYETVRDAVADLSEHGFDSVDRVDRWSEEIRRAARESLIPEHELEGQLRAALQAIYRREIERGGILRLHPGVPRFTLQQVAPRLHSELERRVAASAGLIKLNRARAMEQTHQRFAAWATSVPAGGSDTVERNAEAAKVRRSLGSLPFEERRVAIDQGHKFTSSLSAVVAEGGGAIAATWHSHWKQRGYDYREDHRERDLEVYLVRGSWAQEKGFVKPGPAGYTDDITAPGEEVYCRCYYTYLYSLGQLPSEMLTRLGRTALEASRRRIAA